MVWFGLIRLRLPFADSEVLLAGRLGPGSHELRVPGLARSA
jgi:hypothetical protein